MPRNNKSSPAAQWKAGAGISRDIAEKPGFRGFFFLILSLVLFMIMAGIGGFGLGIAAAAGTPPDAGKNGESGSVASTPLSREEPETADTSDSDPFADDDAFSDDNLDFLDEPEMEAPVELIADPLAGFNQVMFQFNDRLYFYALKPAALGYNKVVPLTARIGIKNFFVNMLAPARVVNNLLQWKLTRAEAEWSRLLLNSTFGVLGFMDLAADIPDLKISDEDLGQTLAVYGVGNGFYIVWPIYGPSTLRDTLGDMGDAFLSPASYLDSFALSTGVWAFRKFNELSFRIGDYETIKDASFDPYSAVRNGYVQLRTKKISE